MFKLFSRRGRDDDRASSVPATPSTLSTSLPPASPGSPGVVSFPEATSDVSLPPPPGPSLPGDGGDSNNRGHPGLNSPMLDDVTCGMQHVAASANRMLVQQYTVLLDQFFDADETGTLMVRGAEPALDSQRRLALPLASLVISRDLVLGEVAMNMVVRSDIAKTLPVHGAATGGIGWFYASLASHSKRDTGRDSEYIDIEMESIALQTSEAVMCAIGEYTNRPIPRSVQSNAKAPGGRANPSMPQEKSDEH